LTTGDCFLGAKMKKKLENKLLLPKVKCLGILYKNVISSEWHCQSAQRRLRPKIVKKDKVHRCTGTEALYRPYGPYVK